MKIFVRATAGLIAFSIVGSAFAATYRDVPRGVWYEDAAESFREDGYLDAGSRVFRPKDKATRAEFVKLIVELNGGILNTPPAASTFDDVSLTDWYRGYMEEAAKEGWVKGKENCVGTHPCFARPNDPITRAEAAALVVRAFGLNRTGDSLPFSDVWEGAWYADAMMTLADQCIIFGDDQTRSARPSDNMIRAEMIVMLYRIDQAQVYGTDCGTSNRDIRSVTATSDRTLEVEFLTTVDEDSLVETAVYSITGGSGTHTILSVEDIPGNADNSAELHLQEPLECGTTYTLDVNQMAIWSDTVFDASMDFSGYCS